LIRSECSNFMASLVLLDNSRKRNHKVHPAGKDRKPFGRSLANAPQRLRLIRARRPGKDGGNRPIHTSGTDGTGAGRRLIVLPVGAMRLPTSAESTAVQARRVRQTKRRSQSSLHERYPRDFLSFTSSRDSGAVVARIAGPTTDKKNIR